ncbi:hypothetical protein EB796_011518 [Bugula neritina]|uniref:Uncharacterized protein n=1 Tax=Bugula neritina TaxID=10212 RepID=A0A7J7JXY5_BUGNE|nr:hypothetical protein EB796_011518 [Bugula neritina]
MAGVLHLLFVSAVLTATVGQSSQSKFHCKSLLQNLIQLLNSNHCTTSSSHYNISSNHYSTSSSHYSTSSSHYNTSSSHYNISSSHYTSATTVTIAPAPVTIAPAPATTALAPVTTTLALATTTSAPATTAPAPVTIAPAPVTIAPAPATTIPSTANTPTTTNMPVVQPTVSSVPQSASTTRTFPSSTSSSRVTSHMPHLSTTTTSLTTSTMNNPTVTLHSNSDTFPDFYVGQSATFTCNATGFVSLQRMHFVYRNASSPSFVGCDDGSIDNANGVTTIEGPDSQHCLSTANNISEFQFTATLNITADLTNNGFDCGAYDRNLKMVFRSTLINITTVRVPPVSEDVDVDIQPWPIVENAPFTITCSTPSNSVVYNYSMYKN